MFTVSEIIKYIKNKNKTVYMVCIDASKAFDKVCRPYLWCKLYKKLGYELMTLIKNYYGATKAMVKNNDEMSERFATSIGVKQGGPLSPRLFALYIEDLIEE